MNMAGKTMKAVCYDSYGGGSAGLKHVEIPIPVPGNDEILLKIEAASINPVDWTIQKGRMRPILPRKFPFIPVSDVAGEIVAVGPGVKNFKTGDKVVSTLGIGGGFAEYAVAKVASTVPRPPEVSAADGASLVIAGCTALHALTVTAGLNLVKTEPRTNVLVTAASGGVGHYAVQLAKLGNTHVTATCGARNIEFVKSLGADEVLDYKTPEGSALKSPSGVKYDVVIHCTTRIPWSTFKHNLSPTGKVVDLTPGGGAFWTYAVNKITFSKKQLQPLIVVPKVEEIECLLKLVKEGKLKTVIDSRYPLSRAEEGWAKSIEGHATGKLVVEPRFKPGKQTYITELKAKETTDLYIINETTRMRLSTPKQPRGFSVANLLFHGVDFEIELKRSRRVVEDGYEFFANRQLVPVFSAPNFCSKLLWAIPPPVNLEIPQLESSQFGDIYQEDYFIKTLKIEVNIVKNLPSHLESLDVKELGTLSLCDFGGGQVEKDEVQIYREAQFLLLMQRLKKSNLPQGIETLTDFAAHLAASVDIVFPVIHGSFGEDGVIQVFAYHRLFRSF
ncbi:hypothetical protein L2E82_00432 [Cichorium intybus]|uniref:Uncharacterized protein n=1 Tax=Cichorium intybus TaxID=13427 RepID=A0ACB9GWP5_CICIN|nr:hypothetical protein L2E82_00432 [Cichorium intybus]